MALDKV
jgi:uncharacterized protein (UPF0305 family)